MITQCLLNQREILANGTIQVRIAKNIFSDSGVLLDSKWHRASLPPGSSVNEIAAAVDAHLVEMGYPALAPEDWDKVRQTAEVEWTPAVISAFQAAAEI